MDSDQLSLYITDLENKLAENNFEGAFDTCLDIELLVSDFKLVLYLNKFSSTYLL